MLTCGFGGTDPRRPLDRSGHGAVRAGPRTLPPRDRFAERLSRARRRHGNEPPPHPAGGGGGPGAGERGRGRRPRDDGRARDRCAGRPVRCARELGGDPVAGAAERSAAVPDAGGAAASRAPCPPRPPRHVARAAGGNGAHGAGRGRPPTPSVRRRPGGRRRHRPGGRPGRRPGRARSNDRPARSCARPSWTRVGAVLLLDAGRLRP